MRKELKGFIIGVIITVLFTSTVAFAGGIRQKIEVALNSVNIAVNGKPVKADNILYKGTTYVPIRAVAEMLGKEVGWDQKTNTASIDDFKPSDEYGRDNPAPVGVTQRLDYWTNFEEYTADVTIKEFYRGQEAMDRLAEDGILQVYHDVDEEMAIIKLHIKMVESRNDGKVDVDTRELKLFSENNVEYRHFLDSSIPKEAFEYTYLYPGAEQEGYIVLRIKKSEANPKLCYGQYSDGTGGVWFELK